MNKSEDYLKSIKSRMGWQVGLQTATLFAIGGLNSSIREECSIIAEDVKKLSDKTIKGLDNVQDAVQSLETSLIYGIEELKWILGSIDDKLKIIIGLIQFPKSTESNEKYLMGYELYKSEYYKEAIEQFENAVKLSPLNLNARVGLGYL
jgi:tetratricopeptide (TPR) repeat protein